MMARVLKLDPAGGIRAFRSILRGLAERYERMADRTAVALRRQQPVAFRWLRDRKV